MASDLEKSGFQEGCPIATTALETAAQSDVLGAATRGAFQKWENEIKRGLESGQIVYLGPVRTSSQAAPQPKNPFQPNFQRRTPGGGGGR